MNEKQLKKALSSALDGNWMLDSEGQLELMQRDLDVLTQALQTCIFLLIACDVLPMKAFESELENGKFLSPLLSDENFWKEDTDD